MGVRGTFGLADLGIALGMSGLELGRRVGGSMRGERRVFLAHSREEGVLVDLFLGGRDLHVSVVVRLGLSCLVGLLGLDRRFASLDQLDRLGLVHVLGLGLPADQLSPDLLRLILFEINEECLLLGRWVDVFQTRESAGEQDDQMDSDREDDPCRCGDFRLLLSFAKVLFHHSGCVANITL